MFQLRRCLQTFIALRLDRVAKLERLKLNSVYFCSDSSKSSTNERKKNSSSSEMIPALSRPFESISDKTREAYLDMVTIFENRGPHRRNHVEFIYAALRNMESFGVHRDIEVYKALINVFPKGKLIPTNIFQSEFMHYPKQQQCAIDLLEQMEDNGVIPDAEMEAMLLNVFGRRGYPLRKYWRMLYWMPKFKNLSPWPLPNPVPNETLELARLAVERMCSVDQHSKIDIYETKELKDAIDDTWIVSGISPEQSELLKAHNKTKSLYIEGPFFIWLRNKSVNYFTLRSNPDPDELKQFEPEDIDTDDVRKIRVSLFGPLVTETRIVKKRSIHQQNDGTIFAICATGTSSKDSLLSWIRLLEIHGNPVLSDIPIIFKFRTAIDTSVVLVNETKNIKNDNDR